MKEYVKNAKIDSYETGELLGLMFDYSHDVIITTDANGKPLWGNKAWRNLFSSPAKYRSDPFQFIHPDDLKKVSKAWKDLVRGKRKRINMEYRYKISCGEYRLFESNIFKLPIKDIDKFCVFAKDITKHKKVEGQLKNRLAYEKVLVEISQEAFVKPNLDFFIKFSLKRLGELSEASRIYIFEIHDNGRKMSNTHEWCAKGITPQIRNLQNVECALVPFWMKKLGRNEIIDFFDIKDIPSPEKEILEQQDIKSILVVPMYAQKELYGFMGFDECARHREWERVDIDLLRAVSRIIMQTTKLRKVENVVKDSKSELQNQKLELERKNVALQEVIAQIEIEKNNIKNYVATNVNDFILPILKKFNLKGASGKYNTILQDQLLKLTSSFGNAIAKPIFKLSPREIEISHLIKNGLTSKDISRLLNISHQTVEKHRKNIRKKLNLGNKDVNLTTYLKEL